VEGCIPSSPTDLTVSVHLRKEVDLSVDLFILRSFNNAASTAEVV